MTARILDHQRQIAERRAREAIAAGHRRDDPQVVAEIILHSGLSRGDVLRALHAAAVARQSA